MFDIVLVCGIIVVFLVLFASEKLRVDLVALMLMVVLMLIGLFRDNFATPHEGISGFSNEATATIAAMFVLSAGLMKTGAINCVSQKLSRLGGDSQMRSFVLLMVTVAVISAFINNAAAVAVFIPITIKICRQYRVSPTKVLLPISFISIMGGTCTLIGTSANILASSIATEHGAGAFGMFELSKLGIIFFLIGLFYLIFVARRLLPDRVKNDDLEEKYALGGYLTNVIVDKRSSLVLTTPAESRLATRYDVTILGIVRNGDRIVSGIRDTKIHEGDILLVRGSIHNIMEMTSMEGMTIQSRDRFEDPEISGEDRVLAEGVLAPSSHLIGQTLRQADFRQKFGVFVLAMQKHGEVIRDNLGDFRLDAGDTLLLQGRKDFIENLIKDPSFLILQQLDMPTLRPQKALIAIACVAGVVLLAAFNVMPILVSAILGCVVMMLSGCIKLQEAYDAIDWFVIFLLAGVIPLGIVMEKTGAADFLAQWISQFAESLGPVGLISVFYLVATLFAAIMSHNAAIILLLPIGIASARGMDVDPRPFIMAITFAAASSLATPFGYHTNLMVYGPGGYKFSDFIKIGIPLNVILWITASLLIPVFWPL